MSGGAAVRAAAARAVASVLTSGRSLDDALAREATAGPAQDRALLAELVYGAVRHYRALEFLAGRLMDRPLPRREANVSALIAVGLHQLWHMRTPAHAAVAETVGAVGALRRPRFRGLVNAILRRFLRERDSLLAEVEGHPDAGVRTSHPDWLVAALRRDWPDDAEAILEAGQRRAPMWLRVNRLRQTAADFAVALRDTTGVEAETFSGMPHALRLTAPLPVDRLPGFGEGHVSVQDIAAQIASVLCDVRPGMRVLDACAAPGGKAAHLLELADNDLDLLAIDSDATRLERVDDTFERLGLRGRTRAGDAASPADWWDGTAFDRILLDAPCSSTGVIRRHPDIKVLRRESDIPALAARQASMLAALWPLVAPGGCLLYATCSVLRDENHRNIEAFVSSSAGVRIDSELPDGNIKALMRSESDGLQVLPGAGAADGFFYARLIKPAGR